MFVRSKDQAIFSKMPCGGTGGVWVKILHQGEAAGKLIYSPFAHPLCLWGIVRTPILW